MGPDAHMLSYPVAGGETFNMFGAVKDPGDWPSQDQLTLPTTREDALRDYAKFGPSVRKQLELSGENLDRVRVPPLLKHLGSKRDRVSPC